jgi:hypothetical protein
VVTNNIIADIAFTNSQSKIRAGDLLNLSLSFKIKGNIREQFNQTNWERSYNKHDNSLRITITLQLRINGALISEDKIIRKAIYFWTRNPKIPHRIWITVMKDEMTFYPLTEDDARTELFDINKIFEIKGDDLREGNNEIIANINVSWGRHYNIEPLIISAASKKLLLTRS